MTLEELVAPVEPISVADIGAACIAEVPVYRPLLDAGLAHLHAFEGDPRQIEKIRETYRGKVTVRDCFLSDGSIHTLHVATTESGMTSLLRPNATALRFFNGFPLFGQIHETRPVQTIRLDDVGGLPDIDFLKLDVQGAELTVLEHGLHRLASCVAIQLEVSYVCLYENQPSFGEVDLFMRRNGFLPHCFLEVKKWSIAPMLRGNDARRPFNQLLESDIVYVRNLLSLQALSARQLRKLSLIAHYCFSSFDLAVRILIELESRGAIASETHRRYLEILNTRAPSAGNRQQP
ncbi:MAG: FkbM family methyltransferase [Reyranella sp.]|uniref:FkbM family methyltransferase n=1 Tax=Reyranella sp. TaxID=1929291 RepID=UPI003D1255A6